MLKAADYRPLVVAWRNGAPVRLDDIAHVTDGVANEKIAAWYNDTHAIILAVQKQPGTNTVDVVDGILTLLPEIRKEIPPAVHFNIAFDASQSIRNSIHDVEFTLLLTVCIVVLVIFLFLRNTSATAIPACAVPFSIIGTFAVMYLLGYSLNNLSLMALTLSVGFVVDDAIVMLENIVRHMEMGKSRMEAAFAASREIGFTILSMTFSLVAVFIPVLFLGGIVGRLLHEFSGHHRGSDPLFPDLFRSPSRPCWAAASSNRSTNSGGAGSTICWKAVSTGWLGGMSVPCASQCGGDSPP